MVVIGHGDATKIGSLEKPVIASLFHSGLHSGNIFWGEKRCHMFFWGTTDYAVFWQKKKTKIFYDAKLIFWLFATFFELTIFWSGAKHRFCFRESMSVLDQNGRIQALGFLARWRLTSHALYYKIPYPGWIWAHYLLAFCHTDSCFPRIEIRIYKNVQ